MSPSRFVPGSIIVILDLPPISVTLAIHGREKISKSISCERVHRHQSIRVKGFAEPLQVGNKGVATGMVNDHRDALIVEELREATSGFLTEATWP
jgi:hypothetical protein